MTVHLLKYPSNHCKCTISYRNTPVRFCEKKRRNYKTVMHPSLSSLWGLCCTAMCMFLTGIGALQNPPPIMENGFKCWSYTVVYGCRILWRTHGGSAVVSWLHPVHTTVFWQENVSKLQQLKLVWLPHTPADPFEQNVPTDLCINLLSNLMLNSAENVRLWKEVLH